MKKEPLSARIKRALRDTPVAWDWLERSTLAAAVSARAPALVGRVLDVGCGDRQYRQHFTGSHTVTGLDFSAAAACDVRGSALALPFRDGVFDAVFSAQMLDDVVDPSLALREMARVLNPGGTLLLTAPQTWGLHSIPHDYWRFTRFGLAHLADQAGFDVEEIVPRGGLFVMLAQRLSSFMWHRPGGKPYWIAPAVAAVQLAGKVLDPLDAGASDTLGYVLVARRR